MHKMAGVKLYSTDRIGTNTSTTRKRAYAYAYLWTVAGRVSGVAVCLCEMIPNVYALLFCCVSARSINPPPLCPRCAKITG